MWVPQTLAGRIRQLRKDHGLDQKELSKEIGFSRQAISSWETGYRIPNLLAVTTIAQYFGKSLDYLIHGIRDDGK